MDKYEYKVRSEEISKLIDKEKYADAVKIADTIDWRRVKSASMLLKIAALYRISRRNEDSREMLMLAYERYPTNRSVVYSLCELSIELDDVVAAIEYYKRFAKLAPRDNGVYTLRYRILEAQEASLEERIEILEELKKKDYQEEWAYELAYLYHRVGLSTKCVEECDDIILWFGDGPYVMKAMELKAKHVPLTPMQQQNYEIMLGNAGQNYSNGNYVTENYDTQNYDTENYDAAGYAQEAYPEQEYNVGQGYDGQNYNTEDYDAQGYDGQNYNAEGYDAQDYDGQNYNAEGYDAQGYDGQNYNAEGYDAQGYDGQDYTGQVYGGEAYSDQSYAGQNYDTQGYDVDSYGGQENYSDGQYGDEGYRQQDYTSGTGYADQNYQNEPYMTEGYDQQNYSNESYAQNNYVDDGYGNLSYVDDSYQDNSYTSEFYVEQTYDENGNLINPGMYDDSDYAQDDYTYSQNEGAGDNRYAGQQPAASGEYRNGLRLVQNTPVPSGNSGDMSQYNTINLQKVVAESMKELFPDDNEDVFAEDREKYNSGADIGSSIGGDTRIFTSMAGHGAAQGKTDAAANPQTQTGRVNVAQMVTGVSEKPPEPHTGAIKKVLVPGEDARSIRSDSDMDELRDTTEQTVDDEHSRMEYNDENVYHEQSILNPNETDDAAQLQATGAIKLDEVLDQWERMKQDNAKKHQQEIKKRVVSQTGKIFANFDNSIKSGILGELEREEAEAERSSQTGSASGQGDGARRSRHVTSDIVQQPASEDDFDVEYVTDHKKPVKPQESAEATEVGQSGERKPQTAAGAGDSCQTQKIYIEEAENYSAGNVPYTDQTYMEENGGYTDKVHVEENGGYTDETYVEEGSGYTDETYAEESGEYTDGAFAEENGGYTDEAIAEENGAYADETGAADDSGYTDEVYTADDDGYVDESHDAEDSGYTAQLNVEQTDNVTETADTGRYSEKTCAEESSNDIDETYVEEADGYADEAYAEESDGYADEAYAEGTDEYADEAYAEETDGYADEAYAEETDGYADEAYAEESEGYTGEVYVGDTDGLYAEENTYQREADSRYSDDFYNDLEDDLEDAYSESPDELRESELRRANRRQNHEYNENALDPEDAESIAEMAKEDALKTQEIKMNTADLSSLSEKIVATTKKEASGARREEIRDFTPEEQTLFENFAVTRKIKKQIIHALENMTLAAYTGNVIITGDAGLDTVRMAKNLIKEYQASDESFSGRLAKITGEKINQRNIKDVFEKLNNGGIIIEKANGMSEEKLYELAINLNQDTLGIVVIMEDTKKEITKLLEKQAMIVDYFNIRIDLMEMDNNALVAYAKNYALALEYSIDELGTLALYTRIANMQSGNHVVTKDEVRDIIDEAIWKSKKPKIKNFVDVLFARRYDNEDMIVLKERDFM